MQSSPEVGGALNVERFELLDLVSAEALRHGSQREDFFRVLRVGDQTHAVIFIHLEHDGLGGVLNNVQEAESVVDNFSFFVLVFSQELHGSRDIHTDADIDRSTTSF